MKTRLLKRLRREGRNQITIYSVKCDATGTVIGMRYGYNSDEYARLWFFGMTPDELRDKAMRIYDPPNRRIEINQTKAYGCELEDVVSLIDAELAAIHEENLKKL